MNYAAMQVFFTPGAFFRTFARLRRGFSSGKIMRKTPIRNTGNVLFFRRWARRGYAAFASLGCQVKISRLRTDMCQGEERKASRCGADVQSQESSCVLSTGLQEGKPPLRQRRDVVLAGAVSGEGEPDAVDYRSCENRQTGLSEYFPG